MSQTQGIRPAGVVQGILGGILAALGAGGTLVQTLRPPWWIAPALFGVGLVVALTGIGQHERQADQGSPHEDDRRMP